MSRVSRGIVAVGSLVALTFGMSPAQAAKKTLDHRKLCSPDDPSSYSLTIDNEYFPLSPGSEWVYLGEEDGEPLGLKITVLKTTEPLYSGAGTIQTRVVEEFEWVDTNGNGKFNGGEDLIEVSVNYFAQAPDGTVCYFGEEVDIYEDGEIVSHDGSWRADGRKNAPGIFMPAEADELPVGTSWYMEVAPKVAKDRATFEGVQDLTVGDTTYDDAIRITDCNTIDKDCGTKFYAPGVGLIVDGVLELTDVTLGNS